MSWKPLRLVYISPLGIPQSVRTYQLAGHLDGSLTQPNRRQRHLILLIGIYDALQAGENL